MRVTRKYHYLARVERGDRVLPMPFNTHPLPSRYGGDKPYIVAVARMDEISAQRACPVITPVLLVFEQVSECCL